jgi:hypothetical protein
VILTVSFNAKLLVTPHSCICFIFSDLFKTELLLLLLNRCNCFWYSEVKKLHSVFSEFYFCLCFGSKSKWNLLCDFLQEEHYVSKLHFSWPQVSCDPGFPARGIRTVVVSYRDSCGEVTFFFCMIILLFLLNMLIYISTVIFVDLLIRLVNSS